MYKKGQSGNPLGKPKGTKNHPDLNSLKSILGDCFSRHRLVILNRLERLIIESEDINDFKWLMNLKASLEPREVTVEAPQTNQIILIRSEKPYIPNMPQKAIDADNRVKELTQVQA